MNKGINSARSIRIALIVLVSTFLASCDSEARLFEEISRLDKVLRIEDWLAYEGTVEAEIVLENGGSFYLFDISEESLTGSDRIRLMSIGNYGIVCYREGDTATIASGHNIVEMFAQLAPDRHGNVQVNSIPRLIDNYELVESVIAGLPPVNDNGISVTFSEGLDAPEERICNKSETRSGAPNGG